MSNPRLEEVFKLSGIPTHTFVEPTEYRKLLVALRTPGRGVVIEGPSGIGKTTAVTNALIAIGGQQPTKLSARKPAELPAIAAIPDGRDLGTVIIDDFHRLESSVQQRIADFLKTLADEERLDVKLIIVGINKVGDSLVTFAHDLNTRIDTIKLEANPDNKVEEIIKKGQDALNVALTNRADIVAASQGSFLLAQMLCHEICLSCDVTEHQSSHRVLTVSFEVTRESVMETLSRRFMKRAIDFATGYQLRRSGRAPYLHMLQWLAASMEWSISLQDMLAVHREHKGSVGQVIEKKFIDNFMIQHPEFSDILHYNPTTKRLTAEDPQFIFFLRNLAWNKFALRVGYINRHFPSQYDFALSFAGHVRGIAEKLYELLSAEDFAVFYDKNEQHRILAENVEDYLAPIYKSDAEFVVCLLSKDYPNRIWTKFESTQFKDRFSEGAVIPIWFSDSPAGIFDASRAVGGITIDPAGDIGAQLSELVATLVRKMEERTGTPAKDPDEE